MISKRERGRTFFIQLDEDLHQTHDDEAKYHEVKHAPRLVLLVRLKLLPTVEHLHQGDAETVKSDCLP